jgi:hypothetical protein
MNGNEIRSRINLNNEKIRQALDKFTLTDEINNLMKENDTLRAQCHHNYIDGVCEYCDSFEGQVYD